MVREFAVTLSISKFAFLSHHQQTDRFTVTNRLMVKTMERREMKVEKHNFIIFRYNSTKLDVNVYIF